MVLSKEEFMNYDYEKDIMIESDSLDLEWLHQAHKYMKWAELSAKANDKVRAIKDKLALIDAQIDDDIRRDVATKGGKLPTVDGIRAIIVSNPAHIEVNNEYNQALYEQDICYSAVRGMEQKKTALENLVKLVIAGYNAMPKEPRDLKEKYDIKEAGASREKNKIRERARERRENVKEEVNEKQI